MLLSAHPSPQSKRHLDWFSHFCTAHGSVVRHAWASPFPQKLHLHMGDLNPHLTNGSLGQPKSKSQTVSTGSAIFAGLTTVTDRQTDRPTDHDTWSVTIGCIYYVHSTAMRPENWMGIIEWYKSHNSADCELSTSPVYTLNHNEYLLPWTISQRLTIQYGISQKIFQVIHIYKTCKN